MTQSNEPDGIGRLPALPALPALRAMSTAERARAIGHCLRLELGVILKVPPGHRVSAGRPLRSQGLDPVDALWLGRRIGRALHTELAVEQIRDGTVADLAEGLAARLEPATPASAGAERR
ncbi:acyl carrier protein [Streptomyces sp. NPDC015346]|uniref:acyl carrier protein n=1 Tax=Streptomyces sp. NPDC015346 TaxID=3364954 RepID=UPI0036FE3FB8